MKLPSFIDKAPASHSPLMTSLPGQKINFPKSIPMKNRAIYCLVISLLVLSVPDAHANLITWSGTAGTTAWTTGTNWFGNTAPANDVTTDIAVFNSTSYTSVPDSATVSIKGIVIGDGTTATAAFSLNAT